MSKQIKFLFCLLICGFSGVSCSTIKKPFYWKIEKDGKTSYVLGTMHRGIDVRDLPKELHEDLALSSAVLLEITTQSEKENPPFYKMGPKGTKNLFKKYKHIIEKNIENNITVNDFFSAEQWSKIEKRIHDFGIKQSIAKNLTLQMINAIVTDRKTVVVPRYEYSLYTTKSMDGEIEKKALQSKKPLYRLDTLQRMKPACWEKMWVKSIIFYLDNDTYDVIGNITKAVDVYRSGDADQMTEQMEFLDRELHKCLLVERNARWVPVIDGHHKNESPVFIAAGALHFIGEGNVLELLEKLGYKIQRFPFK